MVSHLTIVPLAAAIAAAAATVDSTMKLFKVPGTHCLDGSLAPVRPVCAASRARHWTVVYRFMRMRFGATSAGACILGGARCVIII